jgi:hypothetical protein
MRSALLTFVIVLYPLLAHAQDTNLRRAIAFYAVASAADTATTGYGLYARDGISETGVVYRGLPEPAVVPAMVAVDVASIWAVQRFLGKKHPKIATVALYAMGSVRLFAAGRNVAVLHRLR